jgi:hypothetical protein
MRILDEIFTLKKTKLGYILMQSSAKNHEQTDQTKHPDIDKKIMHHVVLFGR